MHSTFLNQLFDWLKANFWSLMTRSQHYLLDVNCSAITKSTRKSPGSSLRGSVRNPAEPICGTGTGNLTILRAAHYPIVLLSTKHALLKKIPWYLIFHFYVDNTILFLFVMRQRFVYFIFCYTRNINNSFHQLPESSNYLLTELIYRHERMLSRWKCHKIFKRNINILLVFRTSA